MAEEQAVEQKPVAVRVLEETKAKSVLILTADDAGELRLEGANVNHDFARNMLCAGIAVVQQRMAEDAARMAEEIRRHEQKLKNEADMASDPAPANDAPVPKTEGQPVQ